MLFTLAAASSRRLPGLPLSTFQVLNARATRTPLARRRRTMSMPHALFMTTYTMMYDVFRYRECRYMANVPRLMLRE